MRISKRKIRRLERRVADLERKVRNQQEEITSLNYPYEDIKQAFEELSPRELLSSLNETDGTENAFPENLCEQAEKERQQLLEEIIQHNKRSMNNLHFVIAFSLVMLAANLIYLFYQISIL